MSKFTTPFLAYCLGIAVIMFVATVVFFAGATTVAWFIAWMGTPLYVMGVFLWCGIHDSKKRWPNDGFIVRMGKIASFTR